MKIINAKLNHTVHFRYMEKCLLFDELLNVDCELKLTAVDNILIRVIVFINRSFMYLIG